MKNRLILALAVLLVITGCDPSGTPSDDPVQPGAPIGLSLSGLRGVYLESATASRARGITQARDVISSEDGTLGAVTATGVAHAATFTDEDGTAVPVIITRATQLTSGYCLLTYSYTLNEETIYETATLNLSTGDLAAVTAVPSDWSRIFARDDLAWYVSSGSIYKLNLDTGAAIVISERAETYRNLGGIGDLEDNHATQLWPSDAWVFADLNNVVYAIGGSYQSFSAQCITSGGTKKEFGFQAEAYTLFEWQPSNSVAGTAHALYNDSTGQLYVLKGRPIWDNDPSAVGGAAQTGGYVLHLYVETLNPAADRPLTLSATPVAYAEMPDALGMQTMYVGYKYRTGESIVTYGDYTFKIASDALSTVDTSLVPVDNTLPDGSTAAYYVSNWIYSGGHIYAGPYSSSDSINLVGLGAGTASVGTLVSDPTITNWTVVAGVLFYTNASGTFRAAVNTTGGSLGTVEPYSGGAVVAVTQ